MNEKRNSAEGKFRQESQRAGADTSGQSVPKRRRPKYRRESEPAPADELRENVPGSSAEDGNTDAPPTGEAGPDRAADPSGEPTLGQNVPKSRPSKFRRDSRADPAGEPASGQSVPKSRPSKFHQDSEQARPADKLRHEDAAEGGPAGGNNADAPPTGEAVPPKGRTGTGKAKPDKDAARLNRSKLRMEKSGEKLEKAKEKLAAQKAPKKPGPIKKTGRTVGAGVHGYVHGKIFQVEDENVGVEGAHRSELVGEAALRGTSRFVKKRIRTHPARAVRKAEAKNIRATADYQFRKAAQEHPELKKNAVSQMWQKRRLRKQYQKRAKETAKQSAKAAGKTTAATGRAVAGFVKRHPVGVLIALGCVLLIFGLQSCASSMVSLGNAAIGAVGASTYPSEDGDMLGAEAAYVEMEAELQNYLDTYESTHDYDEYHFNLAEIQHDPYDLISILSALHEGAWTLDDVRGDLSMLFEMQYILTEDVEVEVRYRTETRTDSEGNDYDVEVPYNYYICTVTLKNENLSHLPILIMSEEQLSRFALYTATLGNRPDLFGGTVGEFTDYDVPEEYLYDERFAAMLTEAEKYLGYPYVWGGSSPSTSFDCSGYLSWVLNHSGWNVGRLGAQGLYNICNRTNNPQPGDLVFFVGTYDTPGVSHCGLYVGDGMMLHCGSPIGYANLNSSYWQSHFYAYGRLP